jgi:hypothetical protein
MVTAVSMLRKRSGVLPLAKALLIFNFAVSAVKKESSMKTKHGLFFGFAILLIAVMFTVVGCKNDVDDSILRTSGSFTLTGLPEYNGKYAQASGLLPNTTTTVLVGIGSLKDTGPTGVQISEGTVTLPLYTVNDSDPMTLYAYSGSDIVADFSVIFANTEGFTEAGGPGLSFTNVQFINGMAAKVASQGTSDPWYNE